MNFNNVKEVDSAKKATGEKKSLQVAKGKVTTRFLWNACKALSVGLLLLTFGTSMAIVGYYADQLSIRSETRGNSTITVKNESRGFHLNNLSYVGPIIMGIGGFIVVAAWVMTFEARENAAKVIPARFKLDPNASMRKSTPAPDRLGSKRAEPKKNNGCQTIEGRVCEAFKSDFAKSFSRELLEKSINEESMLWWRKFFETNLNKYPSAPNLTANHSGFSNENCMNPYGRVEGDFASAKLSCRSALKELDFRTEDLHSSGTTAKNLLFYPHHFHRQAFSIDNSFRENSLNSTPLLTRFSRWESGKSAESKKDTEADLGSNAEVTGSQISMALDLHDYQVTLKVKDKSANKRSATAKKHPLLRQNPVEEDREDQFLQYSHVSRFLIIPNISDSTKTHSYPGLQSTPSIRIPKIEKNFRSKSDSQCPFAKRNGTQQDDPKLFCVESHLKKLNLSCENIKIGCTKKHFPFVAPERRTNSCECCTQRHLNNIECLSGAPYKPVCNVCNVESSLILPFPTVLHAKKYPLVRSNAIRKKYNKKIKSSQSVEERTIFRNVSKDKMPGSTIRSASFSPTRQTCKNIFSFKSESLVKNTFSQKGN